VEQATQASRAATAFDVPASGGPGRFDRIATTAIYRADAVLRRSPALQAHPLSRAACVVLHPEDALALGLGHGSAARVHGTMLPVEISLRVPRGAAWIEAGHAAVAALPPHGAPLDIVKA
jgi:NADH-quinone oxidoreductase subunit G